MIYAQPQAEHAISELACEIKNVESAKWYRRLRIIQLSMAGHPVKQLSEQFDLCRATIRDYIKAYNQGNLQQLRPQKQPGRPKKAGQLTGDRWQEILSQTPNQYQKLETDSRQWTLELLAVYAKQYLDTEVHFSTIYKAMKRCGYRTGRSKLRIGSPDPDYIVKRQTAEQLRKKPSRGN